MLCLLVALAAAVALYALLNSLYRKPLVNDVEGKRVFITGTDTGFGRALALSLDGRGVLVYAGCLTEVGAEALRQEGSDRLRVLSLDVSKVESIRAAKELVEADLPAGEGLWGVVNNAGIHRGMLFGITTCDDFIEAFSVNFFGTVNVNEIFAPLVKQVQGRIVNVISSVARLSGAAEPYLSSKVALLPYTDGLRRWMSLFDVRVAAIEPGYFHTEINKPLVWGTGQIRGWERLAPDDQKLYGEAFFHQYNEELAFYLGNIPLSRFNKIQHVVNAMTHALFAKHPKIRYTVGWDAILFLRFIVHVPDWLMDVALKYGFPSLTLLRKRLLQNSKKIA